MVGAVFEYGCAIFGFGIVDALHYVIRTEAAALTDIVFGKIESPECVDVFVVAFCFPERIIKLRIIDFVETFL